MYLSDQLQHTVYVCSAIVAIRDFYRFIHFTPFTNTHLNSTILVQPLIKLLPAVFPGSPAISALFMLLPSA